MNNNDHSIIRRLLLLGGYLQKAGNRITAEFGLSQQQFIVLHEVVRKNGVNQKQLVGELLFEKSNTSKIVKKLHNEELIQITRPEYDKRSTHLAPTEKGKKIHTACLARMNSWNHAFLMDLQEEEKHHVRQVLKRLVKLIPE